MRFTRVMALLLGFAMVLFLGVTTAGPASAQPRQAPDPAPVPVSGALQDGTGAVEGTFDVERFVSEDGVLSAVGTFTGTITDASGAVTSGSQQIALPVDLAATDGTCEILNLVLGPLDLDLLGLQVHLDQVVLDIVAQSGPGKLLGNLLCAVAGLLDGPTGVDAILDTIARLLNRLLGALG